MITTFKLLCAAVLTVSIGGFATHSADTGKNGQFLFDKETLGGNGRTCVTCHSKKTGTFSIDEAQQRFAKDPNDSLFRSLDSDAGDGASYTRLLNTGTVKIDVPLPPNVKLVGNPSATQASFFRGTPTVKNVTTLQEFLMSDGREVSANLQHQALGAIHQHTQNTLEPTPDQLDKIADFERKDQRFFSSKALQDFANGGPPPQLPAGNTASEKRGRQFFNPNRQCGVCHGGPMLDTSTEFDQLAPPGGRKFHAVGAGFQLGPLDQAYDTDGNLVLEPTNPNANKTFEFTMPDGSTVLYADPDPGRSLITGDFFDTDLFKTPTLWGIKDTAPYFHDNSARTLEELMDHYQRFFQFINDVFGFTVFELMSEQDKADIVAFLKLL
jgi:hypothetical protein